MNSSMRTISNVVTNSCCFPVRGPNSSDNHGNKELCILSQVCDKVSRSLLMSLIKLDFRSFYFIILSKLFSFLAVLSTNSARFILKKSVEHSSAKNIQHKLDGQKVVIKCV